MRPRLTTAMPERLSGEQPDDPQHFRKFSLYDSRPLDSLQINPTDQIFRLHRLEIIRPFALERTQGAVAVRRSMRGAAWKVPKEQRFEAWVLPDKPDTVLNSQSAGLVCAIGRMPDLICVEQDEPVSEPFTAALNIGDPSHRALNPGKRIAGLKILDSEVDRQSSSLGHRSDQNAVLDL